MFTENEIKKEASTRTSDPSPLRLTGKPLYRFILEDVLNVKDKMEKSSSLEELRRVVAKQAYLFDKQGAMYGLEKTKSDIGTVRKWADGRFHQKVAENGDSGDWIGLSKTQTRIFLANKAPLITSVKSLPVRG